MGKLEDSKMGLELAPDLIFWQMDDSSSNRKLCKRGNFLKNAWFVTVILLDRLCLLCLPPKILLTTAENSKVAEFLS